MYQEVTDQIEVMVDPEYLAKQSDPKRDFYLFAYHITITNHSRHAVRLIDRHWVVINGHGIREDVEGKGVIGLQPLVDAGDSFTYTSACPLDTPTGNMRGSYGMLREDGSEFRAKIPLFFLRHPDTFIHSAIKSNTSSNDLRV